MTTLDKETRYRVKYAMKHAEQDSYAEGCLPNTVNSSTIEWNFDKSNIESLIEACIDLTGADAKDVMLNACEEIGRIDIQVYEDENGSRVYESEEHKWNAWKEGKRKLWLCTYSFYVEECICAPFDFKDVKASGKYATD